MRTIYYACSVVFAVAVIGLAAKPAIGGRQAQGSSFVQLQSSTPGTQQVGSANISGVMKAGNFNGNGSLINNIGAPNITTGLLADARLGPNVPLINRLNTFSAVQRFASNVIMTSQFQTVLFPAVTGAPQKPMITMFATGTNNTDRFVLAQSIASPDTGLMFSDAVDTFRFRSPGAGSALSIDVANGKVGIGVDSPTNLLDIDASTNNLGTAVNVTAGSGNNATGVVSTANGTGGVAFSGSVQGGSAVNATATSGTGANLTSGTGQGAIVNNSSNSNPAMTINALGVTSISDRGLNIFNVSTTAATAYATNQNTGYAIVGEIAGQTSNAAVWGLLFNTNSLGDAVRGTAGGSGVAIRAVGNQTASGTKSFEIDHPLDPQNKLLRHYCDEGPQPYLVYRGHATLDSRGEAVVDLPDYFDAINRDVEYQLTCVGGYAPVYVADEVKNNQFKIAGGRPGLKVSWTVQGIRNDAWVRAYGAPTEVEKRPEQKGKYVSPEAWGQPASLGIYNGRDGSVARTIRKK